MHLPIFLRLWSMYLQFCPFRESCLVSRGNLTWSLLPLYLRFKCICALLPVDGNNSSDLWEDFGTLTWWSNPTCYVSQLSLRTFVSVFTFWPQNSFLRNETVNCRVHLLFLNSFLHPAFWKVLPFQLLPWGKTRGISAFGVVHCKIICCLF